MKEFILIVSALLMFSGNSFAAKWLPLPATDIKSKCPPNNYGGTNYPWASNCGAVVRAWSGAVWDDANRAMYIWGGGHGDYIGNEIYKVDISLETGVKTTRITDPDIWPPGTFGPCVDEVPGTKNPVARHTYGNMAFLPAKSTGLGSDKIWIHGGSLSCGSGGFGSDDWMFDLSTKTWTKLNPTGTNPGRSILFAAYHPGNNKVYTINGGNGANAAFYAYDVASNTWSKLRTFSKQLTTGDSSYRNAVIVGNDYYFIGGNGTNAGGLWKINVNGRPDYEYHQITTTGTTEIEYATCPGFAYDTKRNLLVAWNGGSPSDRNYTSPQTIYTLNMSAWVWTKTTVNANAPMFTAAPPHGVWGRFAYSSKMDCYVVLSDYDQNATLFCPNDYPTDLWFSRSLAGSRGSNACENGQCKHIRMGIASDNLIYFFGGDHAGGSAASNVHAYNVETDTWITKIPLCATEGTIQLDGMDQGPLAYNSADEKFYYFFLGNYCQMCRTGQSCTTSYVYDPNCSHGNCRNSAMVTQTNRTYDPVSNTWSGTPLKKSPGTTYTLMTNTIYDATLNKIIGFLGSGRNGIGVYYYDAARDSWTSSVKIRNTDFPETDNVQPAHDKVGRAAYLWDAHVGRIFKYNIATDTMSLINSSAPTRVGSTWNQFSAVWDSTNKIMLLPQSQDIPGQPVPMKFHSYKPSTDTWVKDIAMNRWNGKKPYGREPIYDSAHNLLVVLGYVWDTTNGTNQMWFYRYGSPP